MRKSKDKKFDKNDRTIETSLEEKRVEKVCREGQRENNRKTELGGKKVQRNVTKKKQKTQRKKSSVEKDLARERMVDK